MIGKRSIVSSWGIPLRPKIHPAYSLAVSRHISRIVGLRPSLTSTEPSASFCSRDLPRGCTKSSTMTRPWSLETPGAKSLSSKRGRRSGFYKTISSRLKIMPGEMGRFLPGTSVRPATWLTVTRRGTGGMCSSRCVRPRAGAILRTSTSNAQSGMALPKTRNGGRLKFETGQNGSGLA